jgi:hypothetical protein
MLRSGRSIGFTAEEVEETQALGIDLRGVKTPDDFAYALVLWIHALGEVRPDLWTGSRRIWRRRNGRRNLSVAPSSDCPEQS